MESYPTTSVTFLIADAGESLLLWEQHAAAMQAALPQYRAIIHQAVSAHHGEVFNLGSDTLQAAFYSVPDAVNAALQAQRIILATPWDLPLRPRLALLTGTSQRLGNEFLGPAPHRAARQLSVAHSGQVLLCRTTADLCRDSLPAGVSLIDLGEHRLPDLTRSERLFQLAAPGLPAGFPPLKSLNNQDTNLPVQSDLLVGRQTELKSITHMLRSTETRLVTLTGTGGTGKTRLSLQIAADLLPTFQDGVFFIPLDQIIDSNLVPAAIATALSLDQSGNQSVEDKIVAHLQKLQILLVLDNFEHLLPAVSTVSTLLTACSQLKIIVTSREPLRLRGESEYPVNPLPLPDPRHPVPPEQLAQFASVALFIQRAQAARPDFNVDNASAPAVAEICTLLDGLPLAIELAAARVRMFSPQALLARLKAQPGLLLLSPGARDLPTRQHTLQNTMQWSYNLLDPDEQALFRRLGVFSGGFTIEAVEAVCRLVDEPVRNAFESMGSLAEKGLIRPSEDGSGEVRFSMMFLLRQFALSHLQAAGELPALYTTHAAYYLSLAERAKPELITNNQANWFAILEREHDNLRTALSWAISKQMVEIGIRLAVSLWRFWVHHGDFREGRSWLEQVLSLPGTANIAPDLNANLLRGAAALARSLGDYEAARTYYEQCLDIRRRLGDRLEIGRAAGNLGYLLTQMGEYDSGTQLLEESIYLSRATGDQKSLSITLNKRAIIAVDQNDYSLARQLLDESLTLMRVQNDLEGIGITLGGLGNLDLYQGNYDQAKRFYEESFKIHQALGQQLHTMEALAWIGWVLLLQGDLSGARSKLEEALKAFREMGDKREIAECLEGLAGVASAEGSPSRSIRLFSAAEALRAAIGVPLPPSDRALNERVMASVHSKVKKEDYAQAWSAGRQMLADGLEKVIAYALEGNIRQHQTDQAYPAGLTSREVEILRLLAQGLADAQIAQNLVISPRTVNAHITSIYSKLGVNSRAAATRFAAENGLT